MIIRLGDFALMAGDFAAAAGHYSQFRSTFPSSKRAPEAGYLLAYCQYRQGMRDAAARLVSQILTQDVDPTVRQQLSKLQIVLLSAAGKNSDAADALKAYTAKYPDDTTTRVDYIKDLFLLRRFADVTQETDALRLAQPSLDEKDPASGVTVSYLKGLSLISSKDYGKAVTELSSIQPEEAQKAGLGVIIPYARYYLGWAYLRMSDFSNAARVFDDLQASYPNHELAPMVAYLAGWSHFSRGEYDKAAAAFASVMDKPGQGDLAEKSRYLYAKSLLNEKKTTEAIPVLVGIANASPPTAWAPDALFDYASALADSGQPRPAADAFKRLVDTFPASPLSEDASYRRAETFYLNGMLADARAAFDDYRTRFPHGKLVDAALYWGGKAAQSMGEGMAAALLWERLSTAYPQSSFRGRRCSRRRTRMPRRSSTRRRWTCTRSSSRSIRTRPAPRARTSRRSR